MERVRVVTIIVSLNDEPVVLVELIEGMDSIDLSLNDGSFVGSHTR